MIPGMLLVQIVQIVQMEMYDDRIQLGQCVRSCSTLATGTVQVCVTYTYIHVPYKITSTSTTVPYTVVPVSSFQSSEYKYGLFHSETAYRWGS